MAEYIYTGVVNSNGNRYERTISVEEFNNSIDLEKIEDRRIRTTAEVLLRMVNDEDSPLEHVDTYLREDGMWRVQLRADINRRNMLVSAENTCRFSAEEWDAIATLINLMGDWHVKGIDVRIKAKASYNFDLFYGVVTFVVPSKDVSYGE